MGGVETLQE